MENSLNWCFSASAHPWLTQVKSLEICCPFMVYVWLMYLKGREERISMTKLPVLLRLSSVKTMAPLTRLAQEACLLKVVSQLMTLHV